VSYEKIIDFIEGNWSKMTDAKTRELREWIDRRQVDEKDVLAALDLLIEDGVEFTPKTAQIAKKLKTMGAVRVVELGLGDRGVIGRMKADIVAGILDTNELLHSTYRDRLAAEYDQALALADEDRDLKLGAEGYWSDRLVAFKELTNESREEAV
jgi:hypothetical protein